MLCFQRDDVLTYYVLVRVYSLCNIIPVDCLAKAPSEIFSEFEIFCTKSAHDCTPVLTQLFWY